MSRLQTKAEELARQGLFLGGPVGDFEEMGRHQFVLLLQQGLLPEHVVLDVGCGCLRAGYWLIRFLDRECYLGIEPNIAMLRGGQEAFLDTSLLALKMPRFDHNDQFNFGAFGTQLDFVLARSIWTHAAPRQIETMLDQFASRGKTTAIFLTSYKRAKLFEGQSRAHEWVGRSHKSDAPGMVSYKFKWIEDSCADRGLFVEELNNRKNNQTWLKIAKRPSATH